MLNLEYIKENKLFGVGEIEAKYLDEDGIVESEIITNLLNYLNQNWVVVGKPELNRTLVDYLQGNLQEVVRLKR